MMRARFGRDYRGPDIHGRATPLKTGVKLCMATSTVGMAFRFLWSRSSVMRSWYGQKISFCARPPLGVGDVPVAGDRGQLADLEDRARHRRVAIAVDDEAGIDLRDEGGVEPVGEKIRRAGDADIPGDVTLEVAVMEPESPSRPGMRRPAWSPAMKKGEGASWLATVTG